jgi:hypothetical protein
MAATAPGPKIASATAVPTRSCVACMTPRPSAVAASGAPPSGSTAMYPRLAST